MQSLDQGRRRNQAAGALVGIIGAGAALQGRSYPVGTLSQMGPGFFPVTLGVILAVVGAILFAVATVSAEADAPARQTAQWRGWFCVALAIVAFAVLGTYGGLLPATFASVFIAAMGDRRNGLLRSFVLAAGMVIVCMVIFWWALQVELPLFQWG